MTHIITVPDLAAVELTALMLQERGFTDCHPDLLCWDYYRGLDGSEIAGRGRTYEASIWIPRLKIEEDISSEKERGHFQNMNAFGHVGAFIQCLRVIPFMGFFATIPPDNECWCGLPNCLSAVVADIGPGSRSLNRRFVSIPWNHLWAFIGFRLIS
jgi:hypothetical protein